MFQLWRNYEDFCICSSWIKCFYVWKGIKSNIFFEGLSLVPWVSFFFEIVERDFREFGKGIWIGFVGKGVRAGCAIVLFFSRGKPIYVI